MKSLIATGLIALTFATAIVSTASAEPTFGTRAWWESQAANG